MAVHCYNDSYSEQDLINVVQHSSYVQAPSGCWNELRMCRSSLEGVFSTPIPKDSFGCRGVKLYKQAKLVMIEYDMGLPDTIDWKTAKKKFQDFLHRHLNIDRSSVIIEGIVSDTDTWYIMQDTEALMKALNNMSEKDTGALEKTLNYMSKKLQCNGKELAWRSSAAVLVLALIMYRKYGVK